jgi:AbrB family looped-hinge helix DNA binding protein
MKTTIDAAGRIMVPKALRDAMGLRPGQLLELEVTDGRLQAEIAPVDIRLHRRRRKGPVAVADENMPTLTADTVRETLERTRR